MLKRKKDSYSIEFSDGHLSLSGALNFFTVPVLWKELLKIFKKNTVKQIDLSKITQSDSSALSLLLVIRRLNKKVNFTNLPQSLLSMSKVNGVLELLSYAQ